MKKKTTPSQENYLKTIYEIAQTSDKVRSIDVARSLGVSRASVNKSLSNLTQGGFVDHEYYGDVHLTEKGERVARSVQRRFNLIQNFLTGVLDVPEEIAKIDACEMEHALSTETACRLCNYIRDRHPEIASCGDLQCDDMDNCPTCP